MPVFWEEKTKYSAKGEPLGVAYPMDTKAFLSFLSNAGFRAYEDDGEFKFVQIIDNVVSFVTANQIRRYLRDYVSHFPENEVKDHNELVNTYYHSRKLSKDTFEGIEKFSGEFVRDKAGFAYFFFRNGFVECNVDGWQIRPYKDLSGYIWKSWQIDRDFEMKTDKKACIGIFERFVHLVATENEYDQRAISWNVQAVQCFETGIGYMLHAYKDPSVCPALVAVDDWDAGEMDEANGRTGKSLLSKAFEQLRRVCRFDARSFKFDYNHAFERVKLGDNVIDFNDAGKYFPFDSLFGILTESLTVKPTGERSFEIPFRESPKVYISTNYTIQGSGSSYRARQHILPFRPYFSETRTPKEFFGRRFFHDFDVNDWQLFDNYMMYCVCRYLTNGLIKADAAGYAARKVLANTTPEMVSFVAELTRGVRHTLKETFNQYKIQNPPTGKYDQGRFTKELKAAVTSLELIYNKEKNGERIRGTHLIEYFTIDNP